VALAVGDGDVALGDGDVALGEGDVATGDGDACPEVTAGVTHVVSEPGGVGLAVVATRVPVRPTLPSSLVSAQAQAVRATINNKPRPIWRMSSAPAGP
jgi:hypothetical protein